MPFEKVKHQVSTLDAQPGMVDGGIVILVTGQLLVRRPTSLPTLLATLLTGVSSSAGR
jgi:hypothetical protein